MDHNESIYNIIPPKSVQHEKPPMYKSKHKSTIPPTASTFHQPGKTHPHVSNLNGDHPDKPVEDLPSRTMGKPPGTVQNVPEKYMKKSARCEKVATLKDMREANPDKLVPTALKTKHRPPVPGKDEAPAMNLVTGKNFIVANAVENILAHPKRVQDGAKDYLNKEDYGKVPKYLSHIKRDIDAEYAYIAQLEQQREDMNRSQVRQMDEEERQSLINGLKLKWEQTNTEYQATTHLTKLDTIGKIKRKERYEAELSQVEKDIERLNRKSILVDASQ